MNIREAYKVMEANCDISVGDTVRVLRKAEDNEMGWSNSWVDGMDSSVGEEFVVKTKDSGTGFGLGDYLYPFFVLEKVSSAEVETIELMGKTYNKSDIESALSNVKEL